MVQESTTQPASAPERIDIVRGTNYLLESLGMSPRIRSITEFSSPILIPIYEKICSCQLNDVRMPVRNIADEIHNVQCVINALCFDTVEFDLSHISGEQVANGDLYAMEDLLEILIDVYHWIKNDREQPNDPARSFRINVLPLHSDRSSLPASSLGAQIVQLADRRRKYAADLAAPDSLVYSEISPIVSPTNSPPRDRKQQQTEHETAIEDLQGKYQSLLHRFEKTVQMSSDALNLSRFSHDNPSSPAPDLRLLLSDLNTEKETKPTTNPKANDTFDLENPRDSSDIEDDLPLILNEKHERRARKASESNVDHQNPRSTLVDSRLTTATSAVPQGRNRLNHSDEFFQIRTQLNEHYNLRSNLNDLLAQQFHDDLDDYRSTKTILENNRERHAMQHHEIDTSTLRLDENHPSNSARRPRSASSKSRQSMRKGFLRSSSTTLHLRPTTHKKDFDDSTTTNDPLTRKTQFTNKHRLLLGNEHDILHVLNEQFPGIYISNEMQGKLNDQFSKHIDNLFKSRMELLNAQQGNVNELEEAKRKHDQTTEILRKELGALQRQQDIQLKQSAERILKSKMRDQRIQQARIRRYFQEYCLDQRKRLLKKRTNEELILKQAYKDSIQIQRERLREMKKYKQEYNTLFLARYRNQLESLENYYRNRLNMFKELQKQESAVQRAQDREEKSELNKQRLQLRHQLESDIKQLQDQLNQNDDYVHYRQLDLDRLKENLVQARITTKI